MNTSEYASTGKKTGCVVGTGCVVALLVLALILFGWFKSAYNGLVQQDQNVKQAWSEVENDLQRRSDLIPNLVNTVKGIAGQEQKVFGQIADARARLAGAGSGPSKEKLDASNDMSGAISRLLMVVENYPELRSSQNFLDLQSQIEGTENRLAHSRENYNRAVREYNGVSKSFPMVLFVKMTAFKSEQPFFEAPADAKARPNVDFGK
jgi:LemA protein